MPEYQRGSLLASGKTKFVWATGGPDVVLLENRSNITKNDDPTQTRQFASKAELVTRVTNIVFEILKRAGIPVAYIEQVSSTEFAARRCTMIPLEAVARRQAVGSILKRQPDVANGYVFSPLKREFFLKTTGGGLRIGDTIVVEGLDPKKGEEDPYIVNPFRPAWVIVHPKEPLTETLQHPLRVNIDAARVLHLSSSEGVTKAMLALDAHLRNVFLVLEAVWANLGCALIDLKIEFGIDPNTGEVLVADVIDPDSWRLHDSGGNELSKQAFRDGEPIDAVATKYLLAADMLASYEIPVSVEIPKDGR